MVLRSAGAYLFGDNRRNLSTTTHRESASSTEWRVVSKAATTAVGLGVIDGVVSVAGDGWVGAGISAVGVDGETHPVRATEAIATRARNLNIPSRLAGEDSSTRHNRPVPRALGNLIWEC